MEKFPQNVSDWGIVCQLEGIELGRRLQKPSGKGYQLFRKIFTPVLEGRQVMLLNEYESVLQR